MIETGKYNPYHATGGEMFAAFRRFFLGKKFPDLFTRIICNLGILSFLYNFCWALMVLLLLDFGSALDQYQVWKEKFIQYGPRYEIFDIYFTFHALVVCILSFSVALLVGIIMVWRQKKSGYMVVIISQTLLIAIPFLLMGPVYFKHEVMVHEWGSAGIVVLLFLIGWLVKRK